MVILKCGHLRSNKNINSNWSLLMSLSLTKQGRSKTSSKNKTKGLLNMGTQVHKSKKEYSRLKVGKLYHCTEENMSGGHFNHCQTILLDKVSQLKEEIRLNKPEFTSNTLDWLDTLEFYMGCVSEMIDEADWLFSGDITEESFVEGFTDKRRKLLKGRSE